MIQNKTQYKILSNCKFWQNGAKYSQIRPNDIDNDLFNYHLQQLVKKDYLKKENTLYSLTEKGKSLITNVDDDIESTPPSFKVSIYACPVINNKVLLHRRLKHPQYGYVGLVAGKIKYGENVLSTAKREFLEETDLTADFKVIGNLRQIRKNEKGKVIEDGIFYVCFTAKVTGELRQRDKEGEYFWVELKEVNKIDKIFKPSLEIILDEVKKRISGKISWDSTFIYELKPEPEDY